MNNHYIKRYELFINSFRNQNINEYSEIHHIIPKSMGGTDDASNLIKLTARQHFIAHWMLSRAYGGKMANAFWFMANNIRNNHRYVGVKITSKVYNEAKKLHNKQESKKVLTEEQKQNISKFHNGRKRSLETRLRMSEACKGRVFSEKHKNNISKALTGKKISETTRHKMKLAKINKNIETKNIENKKRSDALKLYWLNKKLSKVDSLDGHKGEIK